MARIAQCWGVAVLAGLLYGVAHAESVEGIAPLPSLERITPAEPAASDAAILSTRDKPASKASPFEKMEGAGDTKPASLPSSSKSPAAPVGMYQPTVPFGRAEPAGPVVPSAPHSTVAVPVGDVDAVEASEPSPPTPVASEADPAKENPEDPTELTSPIFERGEGQSSPRKIILRALNKVTAKSAVITLRPNESTEFGQLQIRAITCQTSSPKSQMDHAALLDISEKIPVKLAPKPLFRGWMYASSPSITALEHPVYDVTMVECSTNAAAPKKEAEPLVGGKK